MKVKRINAFRVTALLMLTALAVIQIVPAGASPAWGWIPGTYHFHCVGSSNRTMSICTDMDTEIANKTITYACQQSYDMEFSSIWGPGLVNITVPKESYHSDPFFLKTTEITYPAPATLYLWCQVYLVEDGTGTLDTLGNTLDKSPISMNVTGCGNGTQSTPQITFGDGSPDGVGSAFVYMPLNMNVYLGYSDTVLEPKTLLFPMDFPMFTTTGFTETRLNDPSPYPGTGEPSLDGFYMNTTGVPFDAWTGDVTLASSGGLLDVYALLLYVVDSWTDVVFTDFEVLEPVLPVGGVWIPVDKLALLAPYIGLASTIILAVAATAIFFKYRKRP